MLADEPFWARLGAVDLTKLESDPAIVIGLDDRFQIRLLNDGWYESARKFGAERELRDWTLGRSLLDAVSPAERRHHDGMFRAALRASDPAQWEYDCNDRDHRRRFRLVAYPFGRQALLLVHSLVYEAGMGAEPADVLRARFIQEHGLLVKCAYCGRLRSNDEQSGWAWAGDLAALHGPQTTHVICPPCATFHFGD